MGTSEHETATAAPLLPLPYRLSQPPAVGVVGRRSERQAMEAAIGDVAAGVGPKLVAVSGAPGVGKTTLAAEVARVAHQAGAVVLYGWCEESFDVPYRPFREAFGHYVEHGGRALPQLHAPQLLADLSRLVPEVRWRWPSLPEPQSSDPDVERYLLFGAVTGALADLAASAPVLFVIDDLHWSDRPALQLLRHLFGERGLKRLAVVATYRSTDVSYGDPLVGLLTGLRNARRLESIVLGGFDEGDVGAYLEAVAGANVDAQLQKSLLRLTGGNPFFVSELVRHLLDSGAIVGGQLVAGLSETGLPEGIREVVQARLARLGGRELDVVAAAAVLGQEFDLGLLAAAGGFAEDRVLDALEAASRLELVGEIPGRAGCYRFNHALIQTVLYDDLSRARRERLHASVAERLEVDPAVEPAELAYHLLATGERGDVSKTIRFTGLAGEAALRALAPDEAIRWYEREAELLLAAPDEAEQARCLLGLGEAFRQAGDLRFRETLLLAADIAARSGDQAVLIAAALANNRGFVSASGQVDDERVAVLEAALHAAGPSDSPARARLLSLLALELTHRGDYLSRRAMANEALEIARRLDDPAVVARVLTQRLLATWVPETLPERLRDTAEAGVLADQIGDAEIRFWAQMRGALAATEAGALDEVDRGLDRCELLAAAIGQPTLRWSALFTRAWRSMLAGDLVRGEALALDALQLGNDSGQPDAAAIFGTQLVALRWYQGRLEEVIDIVRPIAESIPGLPGLTALVAMCLASAGREEARPMLAAATEGGFAVPEDMFWLPSLVVWAETASILDDAPAAELLAERLSPWHGQVAFSGAAVNGPVALYLGELMLVLARLEEADQYLAEAAEVNRRLQAPYFAARTGLAQARLLAARGETDAARALGGRVADEAAAAGFGRIHLDAAQLA